MASIIDFKNGASLNQYYESIKAKYPACFRFSLLSKKVILLRTGTLLSIIGGIAFLTLGICFTTHSFHFLQEKMIGAVFTPFGGAMLLVAILGLWILGKKRPAASWIALLEQEYAFGKEKHKKVEVKESWSPQECAFADVIALTTDVDITLRKLKQ